MLGKYISINNTKLKVRLLSFYQSFQLHLIQHLRKKHVRYSMKAKTSKTKAKKVNLSSEESVYSLDTTFQCLCLSFCVFFMCNCFL